MRIVIQNRQTGQYLQDAGGWTRHMHDARDFVCSAAAMKARQMHEVADAALVFCFEREGYSIAVPLDPLASPACVNGEGVTHQARPAEALLPA
jgi:hypothetical protein